jgi:RHS repeat-associated protein
VGTTDKGLRQSVTELNGNKTSYSYDVLNRLTLAEERTSSGTLVNSWAYGFDANSNRSSQTVNGISTSYGHNAADQLTASGATTYTYDLNGNETGNSAGRTATYNAKDQTISAKPAGGTTESMSYSGTGQFRRVSRGSTTFVDSALGLTREGTTSYSKDDNGLLIGMRSGAGNHYYLLDGLGSIAAVTDAAGVVVASYSYEPFGKLKNSTGSLANPWRWLGGHGVYHDSTTSFYKMGTRYYDPALGRFTQVDPVEGGSATAYDYANQDPINVMDPDGMWPGEKKWKNAKKKAKKLHGAAKKIYKSHQRTISCGLFIASIATGSAGVVTGVRAFRHVVRGRATVRKLTREARIGTAAGLGFVASELTGGCL